ncbi:MAG: hypothetical protein GC134_03565 [Proteobacteria bacterium]|nr:hypothetical protein [Pseudomonadota bacterium]
MILFLTLGVVLLFVGAALVSQRNHTFRMAGLVAALAGLVMVIPSVYIYKTSGSTDAAPKVEAPAKPAAKPKAEADKPQPAKPQENVQGNTPRTPVAPAELASNRVPLFSAFPDGNKSCAAGTYLVSQIQPTELAQGSVEVILRTASGTEPCSVLMSLGKLSANRVVSGMTAYVGIGTGNSDKLTAAADVTRDAIPMEKHPDSSMACAEGDYTIAEVGLSQRYADKGYLGLGTPKSTNQCTVYIPLEAYKGLKANVGLRATVKYDGTGSIFGIEPRITADHVVFGKALSSDQVCTAGHYTVSGLGLSRRLKDKGYLSLSKPEGNGSCTVYLGYGDLTQLAPYAGQELDVTYTAAAQSDMPKCSAANGYTITELQPESGTVILSDNDRNLCKVLNVPAEKFSGLSIGGKVTVGN